jgi:hypothetical protein
MEWLGTVKECVGIIAAIATSLASIWFTCHKLWRWKYPKGPDPAAQADEKEDGSPGPEEPAPPETRLVRAAARAAPRPDVPYAELAGPPPLPRRVPAGRAGPHGLRPIPVPPRPAVPVWAWVGGGILALWLVFGGLMLILALLSAPRQSQPSQSSTQSHSLAGRWSTSDLDLDGGPMVVSFNPDGTFAMNGRLSGRYEYQGNSLTFYDVKGRLIERGWVEWSGSDRMTFRVSYSVLAARQGGGVAYARQ